ncbi:CCD33 protein, partial [Pachyramphus minor]|nr:CCD33 protein [Pachyramphus minor]
VPMAGKAGEPHMPLTLQRCWLKAEEKTLDFEFEVVSVQFNRRGCYALRLTVENPLLQGSGAGIQLRVNSGNAARSSTSTTDTIEQSHLNQIYSFQRRKFTFTLPRAGFCKNDKNHDVRLHIEALRFPGRAQGLRRGKRVGEAFFAISPRPDQPRLKLSARRNEDWYRYSAVLALLRVGSEQPAMHCGRLAFTVSLHEHRPLPTPAAPPLCSPSSQEDQLAAGTAPASPDLGISRRSLRTPESAYHSLPTEGHAHFPEVREPRFGGQTGLLRTGCGPRVAGWSHMGSTWRKSRKGEVSMAWGHSTALPQFPPEFLHSHRLPREWWNPASPSNWIRGESIKARLEGGEQDEQGREWEMRGREITLLLSAASGRALVGVAAVLEGPYPAGTKGGGSTGWQSGLEHPIAPAGPGYPAATHLEAEDGHGPAISTTTGIELPRSPPGHPVTSGIPCLPKAPLAVSFRPTHSSSPSLQWHSGDVDGGTADMQWMQISPDAPSSPLSPHPSIPQTTASPSPETSSIPDPVRRRCPPQPGPCHTQHPREQRGATGDPPAPTVWPGKDPRGRPELLCQHPALTYPELIPWIWGQPWLLWGASSSALGWQEVGSYRLALKRMAGDLLSLRRHVTSLEVENGELRGSLASQQELGHALLHDTDLDDVAWALAATLKHKLAASTAEMRRLKDRVQQLQNELIRKNDREKELVLLQRAHRLQQAKLRRCQDKVAKAKGLEETVQRQEKVIEVMERVLQEKLAGAGRSTEKPAGGPISARGGGGTGHVPVSPPPHPPGEALSGEVHTALLAENRRLREELARAAHPAAPIAPRPRALPGVLGGTEKLSLLARLEEAQARGRVLERQLEKAARKWGREKQELGTRLLEQENGF